LKKIILVLVVLFILISLVAACNRRAEIKSTASPFVWDSDARCADCHTKEVKSMADNNKLAYKHAAAGNVCSDCHNAKDLQKSHGNIATASPVPVQKYSSTICFKCHGSYADIIKLTKGKTRLNPHDSHYGEVDCFICHKVHIAKSPDGFCVSCHSKDSANRLNDEV